MEYKKRRPGVPGVLVALAICAACGLGGFWAGRFYTTQELTVRLQTQSHKPSVATTPYYRQGTTRYSARPVQAQSVCLNTCKHARNGICDEGRVKPGQTPAAAGAFQLVQCDLGTDCDDCGPWTPSGHAPWLSENTPGPIARLTESQVEVRVKTAGLGLGFKFAYTDPSKDVDVSHHMDHDTVVEAGITAIFHKIFSEKCDPAKNKDGKRGLLVDVGANFGWFSVLAASMGCRVVAFEPVPQFHAFLEYSVHVNGFAHLVDMRGNVVSHISGTTLKMVVPSQGIWGTAGIDGLNIDRAITGSVNKEIKVPTQRLDDLIHDDVLVMKVDVEGWEWSVMQGAAELMSNHRVENIIMEYSPGVPERNFKIKEMIATVQMLINMVDQDYRIAHLGDQSKHLTNGLQGPLGSFEEIKGHNLLYDLVDVDLFSRQELGCPVLPLLANFTMWNRCNAMPEDPNPRSLRGILGHNTNIWAVKGGSHLQVLEGVVGILPLHAPHTQFFVNQTPQRKNDPRVYGMGSRACQYLPPPVQVRHRCPCTNATVCGREHEVVKMVADSGLISSNYILTETGVLVHGTPLVAKRLGEIQNARKLGEPYLPGQVKGMLS